MGFQDLIGRDRRRHRRDVEHETNQHGAPSIDEPVTKAKLILTPLDSHRREVFGSYPAGSSISTESVDECNYVRVSKGARG
jgi:hypothetical protein